jgi:hypothetical protein
MPLSRMRLLPQPTPHHTTRHHTTSSNRIESNRIAHLDTQGLLCERASVGVVLEFDQDNAAGESSDHNSRCDRGGSGIPVRSSRLSEDFCVMNEPGSPLRPRIRSNEDEKS